MRTEDPRNVERAKSVLAMMETQGKTLKSAASKRGWPAITVRVVINRHPELRARFEVATRRNGKARHYKVTQTGRSYAPAKLVA